MSGAVQYVLKGIGGYFRRDMHKRLAKYGLKVEDVMIEYHESKIALSRIDPEAARLRMIRQKRAFDISAKHKYLPEDKQPTIEETLGNFYMRDEILKAREEIFERFMLNRHTNNTLKDLYVNLKQKCSMFRFYL